MSNDKRQYHRISTDISVKFSMEDVDSESKERLTGLAEDCGKGGMFLSTDNLLPNGSVINIEFRPKTDSENKLFIQTQAVVCWVQSKKKPKGMGIKFTEFEGVENSNFAEWIENLFKTL
ncbi:MAG: PilZ domain-containing protein [Candidatus Anammoxibacter sp.]